MVTRTEAIKNFLNASTHSDLAALYNYSMECQVNVGQDGGSPIKGEYKGKSYTSWTDGLQTWKSFRVPHNANSMPEYDDRRMAYSLSEHAEGIGMTGWDWEHLLSRWVAFDFDAISGHKEAHDAKLSETDLEAVVENAKKLDWVTVRKSTGGRGIHLYVFLEPVETKNHNEHAALARAILGKMSALLGFDFNSRVDICGQNMWIWHRKMKGTDGLNIIKQGGILAHHDVPTDWKQHVKVITGHRRRTLPAFLTDLGDSGSQAETSFTELSGQITRVPLDVEHKRIMKWLEDNGHFVSWDADHHMMITHTYGLKKCFDDLGLRGIFDTNAKGSEPGDKNCYAITTRGGGWIVRRYSMGVQEAKTWDQDHKGWTRCFFNCDPDLKTAAKSSDGLEDLDGSFVFSEADMALQAAKAIGAVIPDIPPALRAQKATIRPHKDGRLIVEISAGEGSVSKDKMEGWLLNKKGKWVRFFNVREQTVAEIDSSAYDDLLRHVITETGEDSGWLLRDTDFWRDEPLMHVKLLLESMNFNSKEVKMILGAGVSKCWQLCNLPFQPEYPGNRKWNRGAAQFRFIPNLEGDDLKFPHWQMILDHIGKGLDDAVKHSAWCESNGLTSGADYLKIWIASLFKEPDQPLPYLFLYSEEQGTGKSILHEALSLLVTKGVQRGDAALINQSAFNEELKNTILCVVEEVNLKRERTAANRIRDWVNAKTLPIHPKGRTPYDIPNKLHFLQCANDPEFCPISVGDTRITMIKVPPLGIEEQIPKKRLIPLLEKEASDFLGEILRIELPDSNDRLNVPVLVTQEKEQAQRTNRTDLQSFIEAHCYSVPGEWIAFSEFYERFMLTIEASEVGFWSKIAVGKGIPPHFAQGRNPHNSQKYIGNISFNPPDPKKPPGKRLKAVEESKGNIVLRLENDA